MIKRIGLTDRELVETGEQLRQAEIYYIAGGSTIFIPSSQTKLISIAEARLWPDLNGEQVLMTPGEAARIALQRAFPDLKRVGWAGYHVRLFDWRPPLYCTSPGKGQYTQVDLSAAYHQIYKHLWLDTPFPMGYGTLSLSGPAEELEGWKAARNSLVGVTRSRGAVAYKGNKRIELKTKNAFLAPGLWATIQATLNQIAGIAVAFGAVYVNTDGYIWPRDHPGMQTFFDYLEGASLNFRIVRQGWGDLAGWNCYKVADHQTYLYSGGTRPYGKLSAITPTDHDFTAYLQRCRRRSQRGPSAVGNSRVEVSDSINRTGRDGNSPSESHKPVYVGSQVRLFDDRSDDLRSVADRGAFGSD